MSDVLLLAKAYDFAARKHAGQTRKGTAAEPYINHPCEVASLLAESCAGADAVLVAAGVLHDTVEDTDATHDELVDRFGNEVAALVMEVSDDKSLPKIERKRLQIIHAPLVSARAKMLKLADKTSNLRSLASSPPADWPLTRCREYIEWSQAVIDGCRGSDSWLEAIFDRAVEESFAALARR